MKKVARFRKTVIAAVVSIVFFLVLVPFWNHRARIRMAEVTAAQSAIRIKQAYDFYQLQLDSTRDTYEHFEWEPRTPEQETQSSESLQYCQAACTALVQYDANERH